MEYWRTFFAERGGKAFDWYGSFRQFEGNVRGVAAAPGRARVLVVGCGNSTLSQDLYRAGWTHVTNIDFDGGVIEEMRAKCGDKFPGMVWLTMDARAMTFDDASFDLVIDKGTLDAMMVSDAAEVRRDVGRMFHHVGRVLAPGGVTMTITLAQDHLWRWYLTAHGAVAAWATHAALPDMEATPLPTTTYDWVHIAPFTAPDMSSATCPFVLTAHKPVTVRATGAHPPALHMFTRPSFDSSGPISGRKSGGGKGAKRKGGVGGADTMGAVDCTDGSTLTHRLELACGCPGVGDGEGMPPRWERMWPSDSPAHLGQVEEEVHEVQWTYATERCVSTVAPGNHLVVDVWRPEAHGAGAGGSTLPEGFMLTPAGRGLPTTAAAGSEGGKAASSPRFTVAVCDVSLAQSAAVVLVPQGREHEWLFATPEGHRKLAASAGKFGRLIVVHLNRGHVFPSLKAVQTELSPLILRLLPHDIGQRIPVAAGTSRLSGAYVVEDVPVESDDDECKGLPRGMALHHRRLVFMSNRNAIQSEATVEVTASTGALYRVRHTSLRLEYQQAMVAGLMFVAHALPPSTSTASDTGAGTATALVIGLGGGSLPMFLAHALPLVNTTCVDLDPDVISLACAHFGVAARDACASSTLGGASVPSPSVSLVCEDGLAVVERIGAGATGTTGASGLAAAPTHPLILIIDVDNKDITTGLTFPPKPFVTKAFFAAAKAALHPVLGGVLMMNIAARVPALLAAVFAVAQREFGDDNVVLFDFRDDAGGVNVVLVAMARPTEGGKGEASGVWPSGWVAGQLATSEGRAATLVRGKAALLSRIAPACATAAEEYVNTWAGCLKHRL